MKIAALELFLKNPQLAGSESFDVLQKFLLYAKYVQDPLNVFKYMEEKSICIYFPHFWYAKSEYLAQLGDYRNAFLCLREVEERKFIEDGDESEKIENVELKYKLYRQQISKQMIKYPPSRRRTISDFEVTTKKFEDLPGSDAQKDEAMLKLLETKFPVLKQQKQRIFAQKNQDKPKSWLFSIYQQEKKKVFDILSETLRQTTENSNQLSDPKSKSNSNKSIFKRNENQESLNRLVRTLTTPMKQSDPMRMQKIVDSVEMLKRKRNSQNTKQTRKFYDPAQRLSQENESQFEEDSNFIEMNTMPVGRKFENKKKQVKFDPFDRPVQVELPRHNKVKPIDEILEISRKTSAHKKGILKNKSIEKKEKKAIKQPQIFNSPEITDNSIDIKHTEEREI